MIERYLDWIVAYVSEHPVRNRCQEATLAMKEAFPELERVAGFAHTDRGSVEHWWCLGPDGVVYDPTSIQFESVFSYEPWKPGDEIRVGRCLACGGDIFKRVDKLRRPARVRVRKRGMLSGAQAPVRGER